MRICITCGIEIPQARVDILPNTRTCVNHSSTSGYKAITTINGEGEDTWNDIQMVSDEQYKIYEEDRKNINKKK